MKKLMLTACVVAAPFMVSAQTSGDNLPCILVSHAPDSPGKNINSGPGFVTADALAEVKEFAGEYR